MATDSTIDLMAMHFMVQSGAGRNSPDWAAMFLTQIARSPTVIVPPPPLDNQGVSRPLAQDRFTRINRRPRRLTSHAPIPPLRSINPQLSTLNQPAPLHSPAARGRPHPRSHGATAPIPFLDLTGKARKNSVMNSATISTKGQLVIPHRFRKALHLQAGDRVLFSLEGDKLSLQRDQPKRARLIRGKFGRPVLIAPPGAPPMTPDRVKAILNDLP